MNTSSFKTRLKALPIKRKMVLGGSLLTIIAVFLPWYQDVDRFNIGDVFLGISGPLYLAGLLVLIGAIASAGLITLDLLKKPKPTLPMSENNFFLAEASLSVLMLILTSSVYFHPKFGINLVEKTMGVGMISAIVGVGIVMLGSILLLKDKEVSFEEEGELKPLIDMDVQDRVQKSLEEEDANKETERIGREDPLQKMFDETQR